MCIEPMYIQETLTKGNVRKSRSLMGPSKGREVAPPGVPLTVTCGLRIFASRNERCHITSMFQLCSVNSLNPKP